MLHGAGSGYVDIVPALGEVSEASVWAPRMLWGVDAGTKMSKYTGWPKNSKPIPNDKK